MARYRRQESTLVSCGQTVFENAVSHGAAMSRFNNIGQSVYIQETGNENEMSTGMLSKGDHFNPSIVRIDGFSCTCMAKWYLPTSPSPYPQSPICTAASFRRTIIALQSHILNTHQLRTAHHIRLHLQSARYRQTCNYRPRTAHRDHSAQWHGTCPA